jgi:hypothetical protein
VQAKYAHDNGIPLAHNTYAPLLKEKVLMFGKTVTSAPTPTVPGVHHLAAAIQESSALSHVPSTTLKMV